MKNKCDCYRTETKIRYTYHPVSGRPIGHDISVGVCNGTRERDECSCDGDRTKCDFYPKVREKAMKPISVEDAINYFKYGISHDIFEEPVITYAKMAIEALEKHTIDNTEYYWYLLDDCSNEGVYCSNCHKKVYKNL